MEISIRKIGEFCILDLPSDILLSSNISVLKAKINKIIDEGSVNILLNMTEVTRIDGAGLGVLVNLQKIALYYEVNIRLYGLQPYVNQMLFQTRLNKILDICQAEDKDICEEVLSDTILIA